VATTAEDKRARCVIVLALNVASWIGLVLVMAYIPGSAGPKIRWRRH
jgi:hypothetical protein